MFEISARTNTNNQTLSIDGEEFGGGPYEVAVNRAHAPVNVNKLPVWADGWPRVWSVLRALLSAWEFNADDRQPKTPAESIVCARLLWRAAVKLARAGKPMTCWSILAAAYPAPPGSRASLGALWVGCLATLPTVGRSWCTAVAAFGALTAARSWWSAKITPTALTARLWRDSLCG